jgi:D-aminopeptidase
VNQPISVQFDESRIDALCRRFDQCHLPGAVVGIALEGRPVYRKGFGLANMDLPMVLTPSTRLRICSVTKQFTALAYLLLCEEGRASIDDRIEQYLPELHPASHGVTLRQLMGNLSGLRDVHGICWQLSGMEAKASSDDLLCAYRQIDDVNFAPGTAYCYNNGGFLLLSAAIERIADQPLEEVFQQRIFERLGMNDSRLERSDACFAPNSAASHMKSASGGYYKYLVGSAVAGEGGIVSTLDDMLRWLANVRAPRVGTARTWQQLKQSQKLLNGTFSGYGMGLGVGQHRGIETLSHPGGWMGTNAHLLQVPAAGLDIMVIANRHDVASSLLAGEILDACLPHLASPKRVDNRPFATGVFRAPNTGRVVSLRAQEDRQIVSIDGMEMVVQPRESGALHPTGLMAFLRQSFELVGDPVAPTAIRFNDFGNVELCAAVAPSLSAGEALQGLYRSASTDSEMQILRTSEGLEAGSTGRFGGVTYQGKPLADRIWQLVPASDAAQWGGTLSFSPDYGEFRLSSWSNWAMPFRRVS